VKIESPASLPGLSFWGSFDPGEKPHKKNPASLGDLLPIMSLRGKH
jgi:hypothetical protein